MTANAPPRIYKATGAVRTAILDAVEDILREEGYAAVSSRKVAARAGLSSKLVHYHYKTMDQLFLAVFNRVEERHFHYLAQTIASPLPLRALWQFLTSPTAPRMHRELRALATHNDELRGLIARSTERTRSITTALLSRVLADAGVDESRLPPVAVALFLESVSRLMMSESALGTELGHAEAARVIERWLETLLATGREALP